MHIDPKDSEVHICWCNRIWCTQMLYLAILTSHKPQFI